MAETINLPSDYRTPRYGGNKRISTVDYANLMDPPTYQESGKKIIPHARPSFDNFGRRWNSHYNDIRNHELGGLSNNVVDEAGRVGLSAGYATVRSVFDPPAITSRGGTKSVQNGPKVLKHNMPGRGRFRGRRAPRGKGRSNNGRGLGSKPLRVPYKQSTALTLRAASRALRRVKGRTARGRTTIVSVPQAVGSKFSGQQLGVTPFRRGNMNCSRMSTRAYLGQVKVNITTGATSWTPGPTVDTGGQWFFMPANQAYWPSNSVIVSMARMYQFFYLSDVSFELESNYQPGNTVPYKTYVGFIQDPNLGESYITGYTSTSNIPSTTIMQVPESKSFPTWEPKVVVAPPKRWYAGRRYNVRTYEIVSAIVTNNSNVAQENKACVPFGMWINIVGATPAATFVAYDVFVRFTVDFCEMAPIQTIDNIGQTGFDEEKKEKKNNDDIDSLSQRLRSLEILSLKEDDIFDIPIREKKSVSNKSNRSVQ